jgi:uncharacterized protein involved in exopolysaccharide biosynthesis
MPETEQDSVFSVDEILAALRRRFALMCALGLPVVLIGAVLCFALPDIYRSTASFELARDAVKETRPEEAGYSDQHVYQLADRVRRSEQLADIVEEVKPYPELVGQPGAALGRLRGDISVGMVTTGVLDPWSGRVREIYTGFTVSYDNRSPELAYQVALRLTDIFPQLSRVTDNERSMHDLDFYSKQVERTRAQIAEQESRLAEFKERNYNQLPEVAQANLNQREAVQRDLAGAESELRVLQRNRILIAQQLEQARSTPAGARLQDLEAEFARKSALYGPNHPDLIALQRQIESIRRSGRPFSGSGLQAELAGKQAALQEVRERYSDNHPDVRRLLRDIESLEAEVARGGSTDPRSLTETPVSVQLQTQLNAHDSQIGALEARRGELRNRLEQYESRLGSTPEVEREYQGITRNLGAARQQYDQLINRLMDAEVVASAVEGGAADRFRLLDPPQIPDAPARPARKRIIFLSVILAMIVAASSGVAAEILDPHIRGTRDVKVALGVTPLATIPYTPTSRDRRKRMLGMAAYAGVCLLGVGLVYLYISRSVA